MATWATKMSALGQKLTQWLSSRWSSLVPHVLRTATLRPPPSRQKGGDTIRLWREPQVLPVGALFPLHAIAHAQKLGANKNHEGGGIMKAKSLLLTALLVASGLTFLSSPAGAECWMTCPPGSTATPSPTGVQGATATAEPTLSPEEPTQGKKTRSNGQGLAYSSTC